MLSIGTVGSRDWVKMYLQPLVSLQDTHWKSCIFRTSFHFAFALQLIGLIRRITNATAPYLSEFPGLHELRAVDIKWHRPPSNAFLPDEFPFFEPSAFSSDSHLDEDSTRAFQAAMDGMTHTLTRITVAGDALWGCAIRSMLGLQELELILPETAGGLALVLRHCFLLRSLTLYPQLAQDELLPILTADTTVIPDLQAFKFIYCSTRASSRFDYQHAKALAMFIESKTQLTSLDVQIDDNVPEDPIPTLCDFPLLEVIARLPRLEVLGFSFSRPRWAPGDIQSFRGRIPRRLTALRLCVSVKQRDNDTLVQEWLDLVRSSSLSPLPGWSVADVSLTLAQGPPVLAILPHLRHLQAVRPEAATTRGSPRVAPARRVRATLALARARPRRLGRRPTRILTVLVHSEGSIQDCR